MDSSGFVKDGWKAGLWKMVPGAVSAAGSIATDGTVTFSGAVSIEVRNVFTSNYNNYLIQLSNFNTGTTTTRDVNFRFMDNTTEAAGSNYSLTYNLVTTLPYVESGALSGTGFAMMSLSNQKGAMAFANIHLFQPKIAVRTSGANDAGSYQASASNSFVQRRQIWFHDLATAYDGFKIFGVTDNISGTISVYGYN